MSLYNFPIQIIAEYAVVQACSALPASELLPWGLLAPRVSVTMMRRNETQNLARTQFVAVQGKELKKRYSQAHLVTAWGMLISFQGGSVVGFVFSWVRKSGSKSRRLAKRKGCGTRTMCFRTTPTTKLATP